MSKTALPTLTKGVSFPHSLYWKHCFATEKSNDGSSSATWSGSVDAGTWEDWRSDAAQFPASVLGGSNGWPGERWLDIRRIDLLGPITRTRIQMCADKGFAAVDTDNVDGYTNTTGFPLTAADQLAYNRFPAAVADDAAALRVELGDERGRVVEAVDLVDLGVHRRVDLPLELDLEGRPRRGLPEGGGGPGRQQHSECADHAPRRSRRSSFTTLGSAFPPVSFITCPTKKPSSPSLPPR